MKNLVSSSATETNRSNNTGILACSARTAIGMLNSAKNELLRDQRRPPWHPQMDCG